MKSGKPEKSTEKPSDSKTLWLTRDTLKKALGLGGCAICHAVHAAERKGIHSFLYEGMMFPFVRQKFLQGGGFCQRHFWMAKEIEDDTWPTGGFGLAILCESLTRFADTGLSEVADVEPNSRLTLLRRRQANAFIPGHDCMFCQDNREKEEFLAEVLEELNSRMARKPSGRCSTFCQCRDRTAASLARFNSGERSRSAVVACGEAEGSTPS